MRSLFECINEAADSTQMSPESEKLISEFNKDFCNKLNKVKLDITNKTFKQHPSRKEDPGVFVIPSLEGFDLRNAKYIGTYYSIKCEPIFDLGWAVNRDIVAIAIRDIFGIETNLAEAIQDKDEKILRQSKEAKQIFEYYQNVYDTIKETFKLSKVEASPIGYLGPDKRNLGNKRLPTIVDNNVYIQLAYTYINSNRGDFSLYIVVYEERSEESKNTVAAAAQAEKERLSKVACVDCVGRELKVGDFVAYDARVLADNNSPIPSGTIESISAQKVKIDGHPIFAFRCCLISRADGKRIE